MKFGLHMLKNNFSWVILYKTPLFNYFIHIIWYIHTIKEIQRTEGSNLKLTWIPPKGQFEKYILDIRKCSRGRRYLQFSFNNLTGHNIAMPVYPPVRMKQRISLIVRTAFLVRVAVWYNWLQLIQELLCSFSFTVYNFKCKIF